MFLYYLLEDILPPFLKGCIWGTPFSKGRKGRSFKNENLRNDYDGYTYQPSNPPSNHHQPIKPWLLNPFNPFKPNARFVSTRSTRRRARRSLVNFAITPRVLRATSDTFWSRFKPRIVCLVVVNVLFLF